MDRFAIRGGRCTVGDDAIRVEEGAKTFARQQYEDRPALVGGLLASWGLGLVGIVVFGGPLITADGSWDLWFDLLMASVAASSLFPLSTFAFAMWWSLSIRRAQRAGDFPRNLADEDVIPTGWVESVRFGTHRSLPVAFVELRRDEERLVRPIAFRRGADAEAARAQAAFRSLGVPVAGDDLLRPATD